MMLEISPRSWMKKEMTNRINHVIELFKCNFLILPLLFSQDLLRIS